MSIIPLQCFEFIFIDDCSRDRTIELLGENLKRSKIIYKIIKNKVNSGPSFSRNQGIKVARGNYIAFLDSDDAWLIFHLANQNFYRQVNAIKETLYYFEQAHKENQEEENNDKATHCGSY